MSSEQGEGTPSESEEEEFGEPDGAALAPAPAGAADEAASGIAKIPEWAEELLNNIRLAGRFMTLLTLSRVKSVMKRAECQIYMGGTRDDRYPALCFDH